MAAANTGRHARTALMDVYKAERSWDGWNEDGVGVANELANLLLQLRNSQEAAVWHPSMQTLFPDLPEKYMAAALDTSRQKLKQLKHIIAMMNRQIERMQAAADALVKLLPPLPSDKRPSAHTSNGGCTTPVKSKHVGAARFEEPFALATLQRYSDLTRVVCDVYHKSVAIREEHIEELSRAVESFESGTDAPPGSLDSDTQLVRLSVWLHSPGLKNAMLADRETSASTLVLSDFDDMLRTELGIDEI